ncbi:MAG: UDP-glucose 4-epimerase GalE [bacterium]
MKKILVTGGAGFIGSHVVRALLNHSYEVTVFDNLSGGYRDAVPEGVRFIEGDVINKDDLERALIGHDAVVNMAGLISVPESVVKPMEYFSVNTMGGLVLLEAMKNVGVTTLVFSSTAAVYGNPKSVPIHEDAIKLPTSPYGASKLAFEHFMSAYCANFGMNAVALRYFNAYGPDERHQPETHAIPRFIDAILHNRPITITGSSEQVRDFVFVRDIAEAHVMALSLQGFNYFNLGSGDGVSLDELVTTLGEVAGVSVAVEHAPARPGDPEKLIADAEKIRKTLGWEPKVSLQDGLRETVEYFKRALR